MKCANQPSLDHLTEESIDREIGSCCEADHMTKVCNSYTSHCRSHLGTRLNSSRTAQFRASFSRMGLGSMKKIAYPLHGVLFKNETDDVNSEGSNLIIKQMSEHAYVCH